jgi:hypothetical protein
MSPGIYLGCERSISLMSMSEQACKRVEYGSKFRYPVTLDSFKSLLLDQAYKLVGKGV